MTEAVSIIKIFLNAENNRDWQTIEQFVDDAIEYELIGRQGVLKGKKAYLERMKSNYRELPDWRFDIKHIATNENIVMVEFDGRGHFIGSYHEKEYCNIPLQLSAVCIFEVKNGKIATEREYWDLAGFERQLRHSQYS